MADDNDKRYELVELDPERPYTSGPPRTTVAGKRIEPWNLIETVVESKLERFRESLAGKEIDRQAEILKKQTNALRAYTDLQKAETERVQAEFDARNIRNRLQEQRDVESARATRDKTAFEKEAEEIRARRVVPEGKPRTSLEEKAAEFVRTGAWTENEKRVEEVISTEAAKHGGEDKAPEEMKERFRRLREIIARLDQSKG